MTVGRHAFPGGREILRCGARFDRCLIGSDIAADDPAGLAQTDQIVESFLDAVIGESHAVDERAIFGEAEDAWFGIAQLWERCDRTGLDRIPAPAGLETPARSCRILPRFRAGAAVPDRRCARASVGQVRGPNAPATGAGADRRKSRPGCGTARSCTPSGSS